MSSPSSPTRRAAASSRSCTTERSVGDFVAAVDIAQSGVSRHLRVLSEAGLVNDRLVAAGSSVIVIEHNLDVIARADWVIDLGPGAGQEGGTVQFEGVPTDLAMNRNTLTGRILVPSPGHSLTRQGIRFGCHKAGATKEGIPVTEGGRP
jgi:DNA-binding transcriptional ArsR family regulator